MIPVSRPVVVEEVRALGAYVVLECRAPDLAAGARPGQFVMIAVDPAVGLLRLPFSVYLADRVRGTVSVAFDVIGDGTAWLAQRRPGDVLEVVGPLGHGFEVPELGGSDLLVGGGYGSTALAFLADELAQRGRTVHAVLGARTAERIFRDEILDRACASVSVTTQDGSAGHTGVVTEMMPGLIATHDVRTVFACGPNRMLDAVAREAAQAGIRSQLAVEEFMACGIGVCWTCIVPVRVNGSVKHQRSCTEGPVFEGSVVAWA